MKGTNAASAGNGKGRGRIYDILILSLIISPFIFISLFNHPIGDDYWLTALVRKYGFSEAWSILYKTVTSRYTSILIMSVNPLVFGNFYLYKIIPIIFILSFFLLVTFVLKSDWSSGARIQDIYLLSGVCTMVYLSVLPGLGEGIYWVSSLVVYQVGILFFMVWLGCLIRYYFHKKHSFAAGIISIILFPALLGFNEPLALVVCLINSLILVRRLLSGKSVFLTVFCLVLSLPLLFYILSADSFLIRYMSAVSPRKGQLLYTAGSALLQIIYHIVKCLINPFFWIGIILATGPACRAAHHFEWFFRGKGRSKTNIFFLWISILFLVEFLSRYFSGGHFVPLRVTNFVLFIFLGGLFYYALFFANKWQDLSWFLKLRSLKKYKYAVILILLFVGFISRNNFSMTSKEILSGSAVRYDREMKRRYQSIRNCISDTCRLESLHNRPASLRYAEFDNDTHIGQYFNKTIIYKDK